MYSTFALPYTRMDCFSLLYPISTARFIYFISLPKVKYDLLSRLYTILGQVKIVPPVQQLVGALLPYEVLSVRFSRRTMK
jgi:hypothetical protein